MKIAFKESDWVKAEDGYTYTVPNSQHGLGNDVVCQVYVQAEDGSFERENVNIKVNPAGDIILAVNDGGINGVIIIK